MSFYALQDMVRELGDREVLDAFEQTDGTLLALVADLERLRNDKTIPADQVPLRFLLVFEDRVEAVVDYIREKQGWM